MKSLIKRSQQPLTVSTLMRLRILSLNATITEVLGFALSCALCCGEIFYAQVEIQSALKRWLKKS
jgi:hypothetical protein